MTADYYPSPHEFLGLVATRIINEVRGINRVNKPQIEKLKARNKGVLKRQPWTLGMVEAFGAVEVIIRQKLETRNRIALILLDSNFETIGRDIDSAVRIQLNNFYNNLGISTGPESAIRVNRRAYDTSDPPPSYRVPDARVGNFIFDTSLEAKKPSKGQIRDFFNADFAPAGVVIVRPNQLGSNSSYIIWRGDGD